MTNEIRIYKKGKNKTIARMKNEAGTIIEGVAKCNLKEDEYDFFTGAEIALNRLKEELRKGRFRVRCIVNHWQDFTEGEVYVVKDGCIKGNSGHWWLFYYPYMKYDFERWEAIEDVD